MKDWLEPRMQAVSAFMMGGNSAHPLVCFGLGNSVVALLE